MEVEFDAILNDWELLDDQTILGTVQGDKKHRFADGTRLHTSPVIKFQYGDDWLAYTRDGVYVLGWHRRE